MQRGDVLLERLVLHAARSLGLDGRRELELGALGRIDALQVGELFLQHRFGGVQARHVTKADLNRLAVATDTAVAHIFLAQAGADVTGQRLGALGQRGLHVHLQHEVHTAAQVQTQVHGERVQGGEPGGRARQQIQRHHIARVGGVRDQRFLNRVFGFELCVGVAKAGFDGGAVKGHHVGDQTSRFQGLFHARLRAGVHLESDFGR